MFQFDILMVADKKTGILCHAIWQKVPEFQCNPLLLCLGLKRPSTLKNEEADSSKTLAHFYHITLCHILINVTFIFKFDYCDDFLYEGNRISHT
jgi:hypothetical protein